MQLLECGRQSSRPIDGVEVDMDRLIAVLVVLMMMLVAGFGAGSTGLSEKTIVRIVSHSQQVERSPAVVSVNQ